MKKALFITIEGLEGSGKSSVISFLLEYLQKRNKKVILFREPGATKIGEKIREILLDKNNNELSPNTELLLYLAARAQLIEEKLKKALAEYDVVLCDRFFDSTSVYQGVGLGLGKTAFEAVKKFSLGITPDLTLLLDVEPEIGLGRIKRAKDRIESRPISFHQKLRKGFLALAKKYPKRIKVVNAQCSLEELFNRVEVIVEKHA
jgi:dTMP kinase